MLRPRRQYRLLQAVFLFALVGFAFFGAYAGYRASEYPTYAQPNQNAHGIDYPSAVWHWLSHDAAGFFTAILCTITTVLAWVTYGLFVATASLARDSKEACDRGYFYTHCSLTHFTRSACLCRQSAYACATLTRSSAMSVSVAVEGSTTRSGSWHGSSSASPGWGLITTGRSNDGAHADARSNNGRQLRTRSRDRHLDDALRGVGDPGGRLGQRLGLSLDNDIGFAPRLVDSGAYGLLGVGAVLRTGRDLLGVLAVLVEAVAAPANHASCGGDPGGKEEGVHRVNDRRDRPGSPMRPPAK